ncbi:MAG TPA: SHOCT domain-containing protein [Opitutaceae bacterium]|jgi:hypothetical protein
MRIPLFSYLVLLALVISPAASRAADTTLEITDQGNNTYTLTRFASTTFTLNTTKLLERAMEDAKQFCTERHRTLKVLDTRKYKPFLPSLGIPYGRVVFEAVDPNAPVEPDVPPPAAAAPGSAPIELKPVPSTPTDTLYRDLHKLDELRKDGLLSEEEFQKLKQRLIEKTQ